MRLLGTVDHYRTALGETRTVQLADGSRIHLNTNSSVEVALRDDIRQITLLKGEAQFDVAHDKKRPFIVNADGTLVRAVGTMFNVRLRADVTELTVIEGIVAVRNGDSAVRRIESAAAPPCAAAASPSPIWNRPRSGSAPPGRRAWSNSRATRSPRRSRSSTAIAPPRW
ncbi:FecR family protein [Sphingobium scionense]